MPSSKLIESLKKVEYENLEKFLEIINSNFAILENSPLYRGIPGDDGSPGNVGSPGIRGSKLFFIKTEDMKNIWGEQITSANVITPQFVNSLLNRENDKNKLLSLFGVKNFYTDDVFILPNTEVYSYSTNTNKIVFTGITIDVNQSKSEEQIQKVFDMWLSSNPTIKNLKTIFSEYPSLLKQISESQIQPPISTLKETGIVVPHISGIWDFVDKSELLSDHSYFSYAPSEWNKSTFVFGRLDNFAKQQKKTIELNLNLNGKNNKYTINYNNTPMLVISQDNDFGGILIGRNSQANTIGYSSIYKDSENKLVFESNMYDDISTNLVGRLTLNQSILHWNKNLIVNGDITSNNNLSFTGEINSRYFNSAENTLTVGNQSATNDNPDKLNVISKHLFVNKFRNCFLRVDENNEVVEGKIEHNPITLDNYTTWQKTHETSVVIGNRLHETLKVIVSVNSNFVNYFTKQDLQNGIIQNLKVNGTQYQFASNGTWNLPGIAHNLTTGILQINPDNKFLVSKPIEYHNNAANQLLFCNQNNLVVGIPFISDNNPESWTNNHIANATHLKIVYDAIITKFNEVKDVWKKNDFSLGIIPELKLKTNLESKDGTFTNNLKLTKLPEGILSLDSNKNVVTIFTHLAPNEIQNRKPYTIAPGINLYQKLITAYEHKILYDFVNTNFDTLTSNYRNLEDIVKRITNITGNLPTYDLSQYYKKIEFTNNSITSIAIAESVSTKTVNASEAINTKSIKSAGNLTLQFNGVRNGYLGLDASNNLTILPGLDSLVIPTVAKKLKYTDVWNNNISDNVTYNEAQSSNEAASFRDLWYLSHKVNLVAERLRTVTSNVDDAGYVTQNSLAEYCKIFLTEITLRGNSALPTNRRLPFARLQNMFVGEKMVGELENQTTFNKTSILFNDSWLSFAIGDKQISFTHTKENTNPNAYDFCVKKVPNSENSENANGVASYNWFIGKPAHLSEHGILTISKLTKLLKTLEVSGDVLFKQNLSVTGTVTSNKVEGAFGSFNTLHVHTGGINSSQQNHLGTIYTNSINAENSNNGVIHASKSIFTNEVIFSNFGNKFLYTSADGSTVNNKVNLFKTYLGLGNQHIIDDLFNTNSAQSDNKWEFGKSVLQGKANPTTQELNEYVVTEINDGVTNYSEVNEDGSIVSKNKSVKLLSFAWLKYVHKALTNFKETIVEINNSIKDLKSRTFVTTKTIIGQQPTFFLKISDLIGVQVNRNESKPSEKILRITLPVGLFPATHPVNVQWIGRTEAESQFQTGNYFINPFLIFGTEIQFGDEPNGDSKNYIHKKNSANMQYIGNHFVLTFNSLPESNVEAIINNCSILVCRMFY